MLGTIERGALLFLAALVAGILNAVAGGGTFLVFPALIFVGVPPISANATTTLSLWPGTIASVGAYWKELWAQRGPLILVLFGASVAGAVLGAVLLLRTPERIFARLVPWLLLVATILFMAGGSVSRWLRERSEARAKRSTAEGANQVQGAQERQGSRYSAPVLLGVTVSQLVVATYGGYFGGGIGIMMLAMLGLIGMENIHAMNGIRTLMASSINGVALIAFTAAGIIIWRAALLMIVASVIGGYGGAHYVQRLDPTVVRSAAIVIAVAMTVYFFVRG